MTEPVLMTADDFDPQEATLRTTVNGEIMQEHPIGDLLFTPERLLSYFSTMLPLNLGDEIFTGTRVEWSGRGARRCY